MPIEPVEIVKSIKFLNSIQKAAKKKYVHQQVKLYLMELASNVQHFMLQPKTSAAAYFLIVEN